MRSLRSRFILSHILPILLVVPLFSLGLLYLLETQVLLDDLSQDVNDQANDIAAAIEAQPSIWQDPDSAALLVSGFDQLFESRIILIERDGDLFATNDPELAFLIGQSLTGELQGLDVALNGQPSVLVFYSLNRQSGEALVPVLDVENQLVGIVAVTETLEGVASEFGQLRNLIIITLLVELILAIILALIFANRLSRPVAAVTQAVVDIAAGDRVEPVAKEGPTEIRLLASSVNILAARLRALEDARRRLLANLVHELGRPLGAIRAAIQTLQGEAGDDPAIREELLAGINNEIRRMQPLLEDLSQLHGQVLGTLQLEREPIKLSEWLPPLLLPWRAAAEEKRLSWRMDIANTLPTLNIDPNRMGQVVGNLLSNAIKYTSEGGELAVRAYTDDQNVRIDIADTGPGVIDEEQEKIFEPFYRSRQQRRFPQGLGLGLTIARDLVEAHGGRLEIESDPGKGSQFTIYLPYDSTSRSNPA
jgi:signal transduction histidine kinase